MDKNNRLDKLLQAARETKPVLSFEEASGMVKGASSAAGIFSSSVAKGMIAFVSVVVISVAGYFYFSDSTKENAPVQNTTTTIAPAEQTPVATSVEQPVATPSTNETVVAEPTPAEKKTTPEKVVAKSDAENVGIKYTEVKSNTLRTVTITNATGTFNVKFGGKTFQLQLSYDIFNLTNLLNRSAGKQYFIPNDQAIILDFTGYVSATNLTPQYKFTQPTKGKPYNVSDGVFNS